MIWNCGWKPVGLVEETGDGLELVGICSNTLEVILRLLSGRVITYIAT